MVEHAYLNDSMTERTLFRQVYPFFRPLVAPVLPLALSPVSDPGFKPFHNILNGKSDED